MTTPGITTDTSGWQVLDRATPEQVAFYREHGYLKFGRIFTQEELDTLRDHVDAKIAALPPGARPEEMDRPHFTDPWLFRYLTHPRVLDVIESFIGPDITLWSSHFITKPKGDGKAVPWHTDGAYWRDRLKPMQVITLWLAVDPSTLENGCMRVVEGSHKGIAARIDQYERVDKTQNVFDAQIPTDQIDPAKVVNLELQVGECHFHDAWTVHGSSPNNSEKRRCGYTMRYMPSNVKHHPDPNWPHQIYLVRGRDLSGGHNAYEPIPAA
jgi:chlorinating enzyme